MKRYFNTKEKAIKHLEYRTKRAYTRIEKRGEKILGDSSFVFKNDKGKWVVFLQIITDKMMKDLEEIKGMFESTNPLIPFTPEEKVYKNEKKLNKITKRYKTLDIQDYTINKDL